MLASTVPEPRVPAVRSLGLYLSGPHALDPFGGGPGYRDALVTALNVVKYLGYCGATALVLPEDMADRPIRRSLDNQADEDATGPDRLDIVRRVLRKWLFRWLELDFDRDDALPELPTVDSAEGSPWHRNVDRQGRADGPAYNPLHPEVCAAMKRRVIGAIASERSGLNERGRSGSGLVIRLGPGPTLLGTPDTGLDDETFERFVRETFSPDTVRNIPGLGNADSERFAVRSRVLGGCRTDALAHVASASRRGAFTPSWPMRYAAQTRVRSWPSSLPDWMEVRPAARHAAWTVRDSPPARPGCSVGLDLQTWPTGPLAPCVLRVRRALSTDSLAHDLATSPDLDLLVAARPHRGLFLTIDDASPAVTPPSTVAQSQDTPEEPLFDRNLFASHEH